MEVADLDVGTCAVISAPIGLFREIQRHYITFRDHVWRSGTLGFIPELDGQLAREWLDARTGHKIVHYTLAGAEWLPKAYRDMLDALSEPYADHRTVDGDIFDTCRRGPERLPGCCGRGRRRVFSSLERVEYS